MEGRPGQCHRPLERVGEAVGYPTFIKVRKRKSDEPAHSRTLEQAAVEYSEKKEQYDKDLDAFL